MTEKTVDPTGRRALFEAASTAPPAAPVGGADDGKGALFSMARWRLGTVVVECSACKVRQRASLVDVGARMALGSVWIPLRAFPHWIRCPSCRRRQWCRIGWLE